ncbi:MAG: RdgB/HAM1 family non-canonical purine NTP pyrophosphatase [Ktedonobacterales bacterium]|nr:RdgB/HAM1 family non-canonical purine NTP pyrophosphatase [Ktedonobacterales bacterium]
MTPPRRMVIATSNPHKLAQFRTLFAGLPYVLLGPEEAGVNIEVAETGTTYAENAILKATAYADAAGMLAVADDSGLEIDALGGEPGVYSARWAGEQVTYPERFRMLLSRLADIADERRTARYRCVIAIAAPTPRGSLGLADGTLEGRIARAPRGTGGFGYDPIFLVPTLGQTFGEIPLDVKLRISHRARAAAHAREVLARLAEDARDGEP